MRVICVYVCISMLMRACVYMCAHLCIHALLNVCVCVCVCMCSPVMPRSVPRQNHGQPLRTCQTIRQHVPAEKADLFRGRGLEAAITRDGLRGREGVDETEDWHDDIHSHTHTHTHTHAHTHRKHWHGVTVYNTHFKVYHTVIACPSVV